MRITIAVPVSKIEIANQYAMALGYSAAEALTYKSPEWQDATGVEYSCASLEVSDGFLTRATSPLTRPEWDISQAIDMDMASQAQSIVRVWSTGDDSIVADPEYITAIVGVSGVDAAAIMGLALKYTEQL